MQCEEQALSYRLTVRETDAESLPAVDDEGIMLGLWRCLWTLMNLTASSLPCLNRYLLNTMRISIGMLKRFRTWNECFEPTPPALVTLENIDGCS